MATFNKQTLKSKLRNREAWISKAKREKDCEDIILEEKINCLKEIRKVKERYESASPDDAIMIENILGTYKTLEDMLDLATSQDRDILESMNFEREWLKQRFNTEFTSPELEEEIKRYQQEDCDRDTTIRDVARHFANWQKVQMEKGAVGAKIGSFQNGEIYNVDFNIDSNLQDEDKVKLIILKQ